jgi:hypothetical protein
MEKVGEIFNFIHYGSAKCENIYFVTELCDSSPTCTRRISPSRESRISPSREQEENSRISPSREQEEKLSDQS